MSNGGWEWHLAGYAPAYFSFVRRRRASPAVAAALATAWRFLLENVAVALDDETSDRAVACSEV